MQPDRHLKKGFTLMEMLVTLTVIGILITILIPIFRRAHSGIKFAMVRNQATEISMKINEWARLQVQIQKAGSNLTLKKILCEDLYLPDSDKIKPKLLDKYTGHPAFSGVDALVLDPKPHNPFNKKSYFDPDNNDRRVPSPKPGLLFLAAQREVGYEKYLALRLLITGLKSNGAGRWYGQMDHQDPKKFSRGVLVDLFYIDEKQVEE